MVFKAKLIYILYKQPMVNIMFDIRWIMAKSSLISLVKKYEKAKTRHEKLSNNLQKIKDELDVAYNKVEELSDLIKLSLS